LLVPSRVGVNAFWDAVQCAGHSWPQALLLLPVAVCNPDASGESWGAKPKGQDATLARDMLAKDVIGTSASAQAEGVQVRATRGKERAGACARRPPL